MEIYDGLEVPDVKYHYFISYKKSDGVWYRYMNSVVYTKDIDQWVKQANFLVTDKGSQSIEKAFMQVYELNMLEGTIVEIFTHKGERVKDKVYINGKNKTNFIFLKV